MPLWPDTPPGGGGPSGPVTGHRKGTISNIARPSFQVFVPRQPNGAAVLIAGGGGYRYIQMEVEAVAAARWLSGIGITAFVLVYRLPSEGWTVGPLAPLQDAQRALRLIRANAGRYGIDPDRLGVMGFSAGGHLMGMASARAAFESYAPVDSADTASARPDFSALIYPVITLEPPYDGTWTRRSLIGNHPTAEQSRDWSVQTYVDGACPRMFLAHADDDQTINPANAKIMQAACEQAGVSVALNLFSSGGHGFGLGRAGTPSVEWPGEFARWLGSGGRKI